VVADGRKILSNLIFSQIELHREYFGVVPEIASRAHLEAINGLVDRALREAGLSFGELDYVAATQRPGLVGSLLIALQSAKAISYAMNIPMIAVNHLEAHLYAPFLEGREPEYPYIGLLVSGGNTALYEVHGCGDYRLIGKTVDDAVGGPSTRWRRYWDWVIREARRWNGWPGGRRAVRGSFPKFCPIPTLITVSRIAGSRRR